MMPTVVATVMAVWLCAAHCVIKRPDALHGEHAGNGATDTPGNCREARRGRTSGLKRSEAVSRSFLCPMPSVEEADDRTPKCSTARELRPGSDATRDTQGLSQRLLSYAQVALRAGEVG